MFRTPPYLEKTTYIRVDLDTALTFPGNNQTQNKSGYKFNLKDRDNFYDWYNAYFRVDFDLEDLAEDTQSAPINGSFSLIKNLIVRSSGKKSYEADNIHKVIFIKNLLDFLDDFSRSVAKNHFWYLDNENNTVVAAATVKNLGMRARAILSDQGKTVHTIIPLNRYSFFESLSDRLLPPLHFEFEIGLAKRGNSSKDCCP